MDSKTSMKQGIPGSVQGHYRILPLFSVVVAGMLASFPIAVAFACDGGTFPRGHLPSNKSMTHQQSGDDLSEAWINSTENKRNQAITAAKQPLNKQ
jgi:hypothetical protein